MMRCLLAMTATLALASASFGQLPPDKALATMKAGEGLQVELFAAEPMLINPTSLDVDHLGRVWVAEAVNYRRKNFNRPILRNEGDRIVILTDKDGDGKADDSTVFYQGTDLYGPLSVCVIPMASGGRKSPDSEKGKENENKNQGANAPRSPGVALRVLVAQSPDILEFWDKDGDLKADGPPTKFLTGFGGFDHDHGVHGLNVGPDGKLYFTVGDSGVNGLQSKDGKGPKFTSNATTIQKGTVWRCDLDGNNVELIAHNFRNNYECCVDSFGEIWLSDNDDDGNQQTRICHVMPGGNYGYGPRGPGQTHWHEEQPGIVHKTLRTGFGSPTGICFNEGTLLPKQYHNALVHADAGPREIRAFHRKPKGAGYELDKSLMLTSSDNWFRPSDVCVAPDGSVFVADWYDPGVGGHGMGDWTRGRIYRLTPTGHKGYKAPAVKLDTKEGVLAALGSPCLPAQHKAFHHLNGMPATEAIKVVLDGIPGSESLQARCFRQMFLIMRRSSPDILSKEAQKLLGDWQIQIGKSGKFLAMLVRASKDYGLLQAPETNPSPEKHEIPARREELLAVRDLPADRAKVVVGIAMKVYDGSDHFFRAAINIACGTDPVRRDAILADFDKQFPEWNDKVADLVWELRPKAMLPKMHALLVNSKLTAAQKARVVDILAASDDTTAGMVMFDLLKRDAPAEVKARALDNLKLFLPTKWNALTKGDDLGTAIKSLLADAKTRTTGLQLVAAAKSGAGREQVIALAKDAGQDVATRTEAIRTLGQVPSAESLKTLIEVGQPENPLSVECVKAIGLMLPTGGKSEETGKVALDALQRAIRAEKATAELQAAALEALAGNRGGTQWLLQAQEKKELPEKLVAAAGRLLRNSPFQGERNKAMILFPAPGKLDPKKLPPIAELAKRKGNAEIGKSILAKSVTSEVQCLKCHMVRGQGGQIGPDLSMIGKKASRENLFESLLLPSKAIADQYVSWKLDSEDGQSITGLVVGETETTITLRDANGKDYAFPAKGTERKKSLQSIMPEGLIATLTEDELIDVVEYLTKLQTPSLTPEAWQVVGPFDSPKGNAGLNQAYPVPITGIDPAAKFDGKGGKVGWQTVRPGANGYVDLAALHKDAGANSVSFAYQVIESPEDVEATVLIGTDDGAKLTVNGETVFESADTQAATPAKHTAKVKLKKGKNEVLLKIANGNNPHGFYFTIEGVPEVVKK